MQFKDVPVGSIFTNVFCKDNVYRKLNANQGSSFEPNTRCITQGYDTYFDPEDDSDDCRIVNSSEGINEVPYRVEYFKDIPVGSEFLCDTCHPNNVYLKLNNLEGSKSTPNALCITEKRNTHFSLIAPVKYTVLKDSQMKDISVEVWREYDFGGRIYRIENPKSLYVGNTTHRVVDATGVVHCVPAPGTNGCVLRWQSKDKNNPVNF